MHASSSTWAPPAVAVVGTKPTHLGRQLTQKCMTTKVTARRSCRRRKSSTLSLAHWQMTLPYDSRGIRRRSCRLVAVS